MLLLSTMTLKCRCTNKECIGGIVYYFKIKSGKNIEPSATVFVPLSLRECHFESKEKMFGKEDIVTQYYENEEGEDVEAIYAVPIETKAEQILFEAEIGGNRINNIVKDTTASCNGVTKPNICLESNCIETQNMFQKRLGLLKPGFGVKISLKYISRVPLPQTPSCNETCRRKSISNQSSLSWDSDQIHNEEEEDEEEHIRDDDGLIPWNERPWGETGRNWGDFGRAWGEIKRPWGQYPFK